MFPRSSRLQFAYNSSMENRPSRRQGVAWSRLRASGAGRVVPNIDGAQPQLLSMAAHMRRCALGRPRWAAGVADYFLALYQGILEIVLNPVGPTFGPSLFVSTSARSRVNAGSASKNIPDGMAFGRLLFRNNPKRTACAY